jgi:tight adherence protein B
VSTVFAEIIQQQQLGKSLEESIRATAAKSHSDDLKLFAASTIVQLRSGGNLADMMDRLVAVIRDRIRLQRRVRVLTAQTQFSKRILIGMPFVLIAMLFVLKPDYLSPLTETHTGRILVATAAVFLVVGSYVMNKIAVLKY